MLKFLPLHSILIIIIINPFYYVSTQSDISVVSSFIDDNLKIESSTQCDCLRQDSLPKTCFQLANPEDDPCNKLSCTFGSSCKRSKDGRKAECVCPKKCYNYGDSVGSRPVCGSDGRDYPNECEVRKRSCELNKEINIKFHGKCDPCDGVQCPSSQVCQLDENRNPICRCNALCPQDFKPVCGSDGKTYTNECILRVEGCKARKSLRILYNGECGQGRGSNPCDSLKCSINQECEIDRYGIASCVCPSECPQIMKPVCGSDGKTYDSECDLRYQACVEHKNITMMYRGLCGEDGACNGFNCEFGAVCVVRPPDSQPSCECQSCTEEYKPVCGSDNISHHNECKLRRESCEQQKVIKVVSEGQCDGCQGVECKHNSVCRVDPSDGVGQCTCPSSCPNIKSPVCGSDKLTYPNECELRLASCLKKEDITIDSRGPCDACFNVHCKYGARCELGKCVCPTECPMTYEPICASDGNTYVNECQMRVNSCQSNIELEIVFYGECPGKKAPETVIGSGIGYIKKCDPNTCRFGGVCDYDVENIPHCICSYHCPSGGSADEAVCGSDGRLYENECKLQEEACRRQQEIQPAINQLCEDSKLLPCNGESPLIDPATGRDYSCGDELNAKQCPRKSYCHRSSHFAKCCREEKIIRSCSESQFGCCPDGVTVAQGPEHAGCPSVCNCNKIGSYSATCDPVSRQCHCKVGVGGLQCDRCEHGFWGLSKISEGNSGCIPCSCNMNGSVRDDCEQMTGRCVCKHGLQGMKCNVCPDDTVLDSQGCIHVSLTRYYSGSCSDMKCRYGATCVDNPEKGIQCVCNMRCSMMDLNASTLVSTSEVICASDGNTYLSECQMKFFACRMQRKLSMVHRGQCRISASRPPSAKFDENAVTQGPVRRSTMYKTSQQSSRETPAIELTLSYSDPTSVRTTTAPPIISQRVIKVPAFMGNSYIEIPRLQAHTKLSIELELIAHSDSGVILYNGQTATGDGDFVSISLKKGFVEFRYDLGSGKVKLVSSKKILLGQIIKIVAKRYLKEGILTVDGQPDVSGFSEGELKSLDLAENLFIGSIPSKSLKIYDNVGVRQGFVGCIHRLGIGGIDTDFSYPESKSILKIHNVQDCQEAPCSQNKCENGGTCAPGSDSNFNTFKCVCPKGFTGQNCEIKDEVCIQANPCIRGTICTLLPFGGFSCLCSHGKNGKICSKMPRETSSLITAFIGSSYLALPTPQNIAQAFVLEVWFLSRDENGLILYSGQNLPKDRGDFLAVNIVDRHIKFSYNLGSTIPSIIGYASIMSKDKITLNKWHSLRLTRFQKKGTFQLDEEPVQFGESWGDLNELNLDQPLYIGGIPEGLNYSRHIGPVLGMSGAIQRIVINGEVVDDLLKRAIEIHNLDEYRGLPCGHKSPCPNNTVCLPQLDDYLCRCALNDKKLCSASLVSENIMDYHATSEELRFI